MTFEAGQQVRTNAELRALDGSVIPLHALGTVVGYQGQRVMVAFRDDVTAICELWEVRRA